MKKFVDIFCCLPLQARRNVPGINPDRSDIIIAGAAIIDTLTKKLKKEKIAVTNRGLQDGLLADYITRMAESSL